MFSCGIGFDQAVIFSYFCNFKRKLTEICKDLILLLEMDMKFAGFCMEMTHFTSLK